MFNLRKKGDVEIDFPTWLIVALIAGVVIIGGILIMKGKWVSVIEYIRNFLRFGG